LEEVGKRMLEKLAWRLREKGMTLVLTPALISFLVKKGSDPEFGARPINRAIQNHIESLIAERIIAGEYKSGSSIALTEEDLNI
jgi:ATP-dependent Clp protease ATP-binding subunit ClpA